MKVSQTVIELGPYSSLLFDMDGTLLTSLAAVDRAWTAWANRVGLPAADVLSFIHGRTAVDTMRHFLASSADIAREAQWLENLELEDVEGVEEIAGAGALLRSLPPDRWAVVTSATRRLALRRIEAAGLPVPGVLVSADDVLNGKPDPEGYRKASRLLNVRPEACAVFEDTPAGMMAGSSAGADVVQISGMHIAGTASVKAQIEDYRHTRTVAERGCIRIIIQS